MENKKFGIVLIIINILFVMSLSIFSGIVFDNKADKSPLFTIILTLAGLTTSIILILKYKKWSKNGN